MTDRSAGYGPFISSGSLRPACSRKPGIATTSGTRQRCKTRHTHGNASRSNHRTATKRQTRSLRRTNHTSRSLLKHNPDRQIRLQHVPLTRFPPSERSIEEAVIVTLRTGEQDRPKKRPVDRAPHVRGAAVTERFHRNPGEENEQVFPTRWGLPTPRCAGIVHIGRSTLRTV